MPTTSAQSPTAAASSARDGGTAAWQQPANALASDDTRTRVALGAGASSQWLLLTGFDFSAIPEGAAIQGVTATVERWADPLAGADVRDAEVRLVLAGSPAGGDKALPGTWPSSAGAEASASYGGAADPWGLPLARADVLDPGFGLAVAAREAGGAESGQAWVDHATLAVAYQEAASAGAAPAVVSAAARAFHPARNPYLQSFPGAS